MQTLPPGPVCSDSMADDALCQKFVDLLKSVNYDSSSFDETNVDVDSLIEKLGEYVPDHCYFGLDEFGEGDGFGVWVDWDDLQDAIDSGEVMEHLDPIDGEVTFCGNLDDMKGILWDEDGNKVWEVI